MKRAARTVVIGAAAFQGVLACALHGCSTQTTALYTPYTGINLFSAAIVQGIGCGLADAGDGGLVFAYVAVVADPTDADTPNLSPLPDGSPPAFGTAFSCTTNGVFESLTTSPRGNATVTIFIYAYSESDYAPVMASVPGLQDCTTASCTLSLSDIQAVLLHPATYTTTCTAIPESGDNVTASCAPLEPAGGTTTASGAPGDAGGEP